MIERIKQNLLPALIHSGYSIIYFLFIIPFDLWVKALERLAAQRANGSLEIGTINSPWPFITFMKNLLLEFLFDFFTLLSYVIGVFVAFYTLFDEGFGEFIGALVATYYTPVFYAIARDFFQLFILQFRKLLSWLRKPAQYYDLNVQKKELH
jgi:hypothetical protein